MLQHEHENQFNHNDAFLDWLLIEKSQFYDWIITVSFYAALHKMHSCLHTKGVPCHRIRNHDSLRKQITNHFPENISTFYDMLHFECRKIRYDQTDLNTINKTYVQDFIDAWKMIIKPFATS